MARSRTRGFTLLELMVTLAVLGVLMGVAVPAFRDMILNNRGAAAVNELLSGLMLARSEAIKRGRPVSMCATAPGGSANCAGGTNWSQGWIVFTDADGNGDIAAAGDVLRQFVNEPGNGLRITAATGGAGHFTIRPFNQAGTAGNLTVCDSRGASHARRVCVQVNGRARVTSNDCDGTPISCP